MDAGELQSSREMELQFQVRLDMRSIAKSSLRAIMAECKHGFHTLTAFLVACFHQRGLEVLKWKLKVLGSRHGT